MTHFEKILSYCALAPNIETHWAGRKEFKEKHPIIVGMSPIQPFFCSFLIVSGLSIFKELNFMQMWSMWLGGMVIFSTALFGWDAYKRRQTRKKLGYSFGIIEDSADEKKTHTILEKLLRLPTTPQTQDLKSQLWALADKNLLPNRWWLDVEKEIDAWIASHERDALKTKLLETHPQNIVVSQDRAETPTSTMTSASPQRVVV